LPLLAQGQGAEWRHWGGDAGGQKYSPLRQIHRGNVGKLEVAWTYRTGEISDGSESPSRSAFETTPLYVDGVLYVTTPFNRLVALEAETGKERWAFDPKLDRTKPLNLFISRGASYWTDGKARRIFYGTQGGRLYSVDAATGKPDAAFGEGGSIDLRKGVAEAWPDKGYGMTSPPAVYRNVVICGAWTADGEPQGPAGDIRGFDAGTGKLLWTFHTVPRAGEFGYETWPAGAGKDRAAVNAWSVLSVDAERGMVFVPLTSPAYDYYGGDRKGDGLFGDSVVALDAVTGKRVWHFQTIHHNIWDYDLPAQPNLVTVRHGGRMVAAVAQVTKTGFVFLLDRVTGKPLFPVEERPAPASEVPGEWASATQPVPVKPPPFTRQSMRPEELTTVTPESRKFCEEIVKGAKFGGFYTPIGLERTILFPGTNGGTNWGGASFDPATRTLYVNSMDVGMTFQMEKRPEGAQAPYRARGARTPNSRFWDNNLYSCQQPPWGSLTAIDLDTGTFRWRVVLGEYDELTKRGVPKTGTPNLGGSLVTAGGLVFIGATNDGRFRAFDKDTGQQLWETRLPASGHANPMTFAGPQSKRQFVVIAAGGGNKYSATFADALVAFAVE